MFADAGIVRRCFGDWMEDDSEDEDSGSSSEEENEPAVEPEEEQDLGEEFAGESGITLGPEPGTPRRERGQERRRRERERELLRARKQKRKEEVREGEEPHVKVGDDIWVALEVAIHGDGWGASSFQCEGGRKLIIARRGSWSASQGALLALERLGGVDFLSLDVQLRLDRKSVV